MAGAVGRRRYCAHKAFPPDNPREYARLSVRVSDDFETAGLHGVAVVGSLLTASPCRTASCLLPTPVTVPHMFGVAC